MNMTQLAESLDARIILNGSRNSWNCWRRSSSSTSRTGFSLFALIWVLRASKK